VAHLDNEFKPAAAADDVDNSMLTAKSLDTYQPSPLTRLRASLNPTRIGGIYALLVLIVVFWIWVPETFPTVTTIYQICNSNALPALAALTLVVPLAAGVFDISIPYTMTLSGVVCAYAIADSHLSIWIAIAAGMLAALIVGIANACVVVIGRIDSLVATLAMGFLIQALILWRTNDQIINSTELTGKFQQIAYGTPFGQFTAPVIYALFVAVLIWLLLDHTATGRRIYATGFNKDAARLATVHTGRIQFASLIGSALMAGATGIVIAATLGAGSPTAGNSYLLPAFAGVFVGATQFRPGRFNAWGTVLAVVLLGTLTTGLALASVPQWAQQFATGVVLIAALILATRERRNAGVRRFRNQRQFRQSAGS
jgi:ribose transport system permease protein